MRSSWNVSGPSQSRPSHRNDSWMWSTASATSRLVSVFSIRRRNSPPACRANSQLKSAVRTLPMWRRPVGLGAMRTRTDIAGHCNERGFAADCGIGQSIAARKEQPLNPTAVYVQTNDADANELIAFGRADDGTLFPLGRAATGGRGNGKPHLPSQSSVALSPDGRFVLVTNAGSDDVSVLSVDGPALVSRVASGGASPKSVAVHGSRVCVLNTEGDPGVAGLRLGEDGSPAPIAGAWRALSSPAADPAQVAFSPDGQTLVVTERGTNGISTFAVREDGTLDGPTAFPSAGATPYGFDFARDGALVVTEAFGGEVGAA